MWTFWLKARRPSEENMTEKRSNAARQRRLLLRLSRTCDTLLRLRLRLPIDSSLRHTLPISPARALELLRLIAEGVSIAELADQEVEEEL